MLFVALIAFGEAKAQNAQGPAEKQFADSLCSWMSQVDVSKVTTKEQVQATFIKLITQNPDLMIAACQERSGGKMDGQIMQALAIDMRKRLLRMNCENWAKLNAIMQGKN